MSLMAPCLRIPALALFCALLALAPGVARAQDLPSCWVEGAFGMNFGTVTPGGAESSSYITYHCRAPYGTAYHFRLCLFLGPGQQGDINPRRMTDYNNHFLKYDLYSDSGRQNLIGDVGSTPVHQVQMSVPANSERTAPAYVYGRVHSGQSVPPGHFEEVNMRGSLIYLYSATDMPQTSDCSSGTIQSFSTSKVEAMFEDSCTFSAGDLVFGTVDTLAQPVEATSSIHVDCPSGKAWSLGLGNGLRYADGTRRMEGGGNHVSYRLYRDSSRTQPWGNTDAGDRLAGQTDAAGNPVNVTVYGRVPAQADVPPGRYADTVVATLYY